MTENSGGLVTATTRADMQGHSDARDLFASVGRPVPATAIEILGTNGEPLEHDGAAVGELAVRSPALVDGYWNMPDESAAAFRNGWYRTGDLGSIDAAGYVYVVERRTDLIVSGGINVYPSEVEAFINAIPGVAESAVFGVDHERWGQAVAAAVVRDGTRELSVETVIASCREGMASFKKPTSVFFLDELPRTASLKVRRSEVRKMLT